MLRRITLCVCVLVLLTTGASAQQGPGVAVGSGAQTCREWTAARQKTAVANLITEGSITSWVQGFLVGVSALSATAVAPPAAALSPQAELAMGQSLFGTKSGWVFDPPDPDVLRQWLDNHCRKRPLTRIFDAAHTLAGELISREKPMLLRKGWTPP